MGARLKNRISKIEAESGINISPFVVVTNWGSDCEEDWEKAKEIAIEDYRKNNGDIDIRDARFIKLCFI